MIKEKDEGLLQHLDKQGVGREMVMGHPASLFVLFFTEMWERFSYYGMRALLTTFLISEIAKGGWGWTNESAMSLYGWYTMLVYATPILGGFIADKLTGYRKAILIGALMMTLGHASMALEGFEKNFFFLGLALMILGNGMFKPNISSMVGQLYPNTSSKKDAGYTIFYMGINAGAFLGSLLCGYLGEKIGWHYGFGLAGVFMFFGMLQFYAGRRIFGVIGEEPKIVSAEDTKVDEEEELPKHIVRDRLMVVVVLMIASIFFFLAFEQAGGSMTIFAKNYTQRILEGASAVTFKWVDAILTLIPIAAVTFVLLKLSSKIFTKYPLTIIFTLISFTSIAALGIWKIYREFTSVETEVTVAWFQILNAFFIVTFASLFSRLWEKVWNPSGPVKFAMGLFLVGLGFIVLAYGSSSIPKGAETAAVSMIWLVLAYFFHTMGELCLSPVGLSYVSKLSPKKLLGLIFGCWFLASAIANFVGAAMGGMIDKISQEYSMSIFFLIIAFLPITVGVVLLLLTPMLKKKMHGIN